MIASVDSPAISQVLAENISDALIIFKSDDLLIENFYNFMSLFCAPILSLFILGALTKFATFQGWVFGLSISILSIVWLKTRTCLPSLNVK